MKTILILFVALYIGTVNTLEIRCDYKVHEIYGYGCDAKFFDLKNKKLKIIRGSHHYGKRNQNVRYFNASSDEITQIPEGLERRFPNLETLYLSLPKLKRICFEDLKPFNEVLRNLMIIKSKIDYIPEDLFVSTPNIVYLYMKSNEIKSINKNAFKPLKNLKTFFVKFNCMQENAMKKEKVEQLIEKLEIACHDPSFEEPSTCKPYEIEEPESKNEEGQEDVVEQNKLEPFSDKTTQFPEKSENSKEKNNKMIYWIVTSVGVVMVIIAALIVIKIFKK